METSQSGGKETGSLDGAVRAAAALRPSLCGGNADPQEAISR